MNLKRGNKFMNKSTSDSKVKKVSKEKHNTLQEYAKLYNKEEFQVLNEEMSFSEYIEKLEKNPRLSRNAFQYMYDMIVSKGSSEFERYRRTYKCFSKNKANTN